MESISIANKQTRFSGILDKNAMESSYISIANKILQDSTGY